MRDPTLPVFEIIESPRLKFRHLQLGDENILFPCINDELLEHWI